VVRIQTAELRLKLLLQENPAYIEQKQEDFKDLLNDSMEIWKDLAGLQNKIVDALVNQAHKLKLPFDTAQEDRLKDLSHKFDEHIKPQLRDLIKTTDKEIDKQEPINIICWGDENGTHSYYTTDRLLETA
jgi:hypothetical protein